MYRYVDGPGAAAPLRPVPRGLRRGPFRPLITAVGIFAAADNGDRLDQPTKYEVVR